MNVSALNPIGEYVDKVHTWDPRKSGNGDKFQYIDLSSVDKSRKFIDPAMVSLVAPSEAPSRARQIVRRNDILVASVRPNLNGVALVPENYDGATASTGYCVLRPNNKVIDARYLFYWLRTDSFISEMMRLATGANYPAVSDKIIKNSKIPLPPLEEQKRIASILDKADAIRRKRQAAIELADQFLRSVFLDMFGDPITNAKGYPVGKIADLLSSVNYGTSAKAGEEGKYPILRMNRALCINGISKPFLLNF